MFVVIQSGGGERRVMTLALGLLGDQIPSASKRRPSCQKRVGDDVPSLMNSLGDTIEYQQQQGEEGWLKSKDKIK